MRPETVRGLDSATGIWFPGGDQLRIMAVLDGTPTAAAIRARYAARATVSPQGAPIRGATDVRMHVLPAGSSFDPGTGTVHLP